MNIRLFSIAILISAIPILARTDSNISLNKGDFVAAERITKEGETIVSVKLSKSGKAKIKKLNQGQINKEVHAEIGGVSSNFKFREPITGEFLEMGPYSKEDSQKIVEDINSAK